MNIKNAWHKLADFFENGDLVPFIIGISIYHYYQALSTTDGYVAILVAISIDLIHFRTVRHAVRARTFFSVAIAALTTAMAVFYHYEFYSSVGQLSAIEVMIHALPLPIGIAVLAWLNETVSVGDEIATWMGKLKASETALQSAENAVQAGAIALKASETARQASENEVQAGAIALQVSETARQEAENAVQMLKDELASVKAGEMNFNELAWDVIQMVQTGNGLAKDIAEKHDVTQTAVSRLRTSLNGGRGN